MSERWLMSDRWLLTRRYLSRLWMRRLALSGMIACMLMAAALEPMLALMLKPLMDGAGDFVVSPHQVPWFAAAIIFSLAVATFGRAYLSGWLNVTVQRDLQKELAQRLAARPLGDSYGEPSGKIIARFMHYVPTLTASTLPIGIAFIQEPLKMLFYLAQMFYWQWELALIMCLAMPPTTGVVIFLARRMKKASVRTQEETARAQSRLGEAIALLPIMKVHGQNGDGVARIFAALRGALLRMQVATYSGQPLTMLAVGVPSVLILFYAVHAIDDGQMSRGDLAAFLVCMLLMPRSARAITRAATSFETMLVAAREVFGFLDSPTEEDTGQDEVVRARGDLLFDSLFLRYDKNTRDALCDINLHIAAGETVAVVGRSGAGKTSLANVVPRFYAPQRGAILLDGKDIRHLTLQSLRRQIALVTQEPLLFDDTIAANVCYPEEPSDKNRQRIVQALDDASADFVAELDGGMDFYAGESGRKLSGGQKQRIALARAFYRDAPIIILDEATSALDSETEGKIKTAMQKLLHGRTAIIVAHRFATVDFADRIVVMDGGAIIACGTSDELLQSCALYAELYRAQEL